jgi:allophanate hydrolase
MSPPPEELNAWIVPPDPDAVRAETVRAVSAGLPLAGRRLAVKDNIDVAGLPTTAGHPGFTYTPARSAGAVQRLVDAGAVVAGKTNLDQFATGLVGTRSPFGACRNPLDPNRIAGGSSSGSAVAVATGQADLGLATDTAGSGRVPAALCGIVGLKPTRGLVSTTGVVPAIAGLDCVSILARRVSDATAALDTMAAFDPDDPWSRTPPRGAPIVGPRLRLGIPRPSALDGLDAAAAEAWKGAVEALAKAGTVEEVDVTPYLDAGTLLYGGSFVAARWHAFGPFLESHPDGADPTVWDIVRRGRDLPAHQLVDDVTRILQLQRQLAETWATVDAIAVPTVGLAPTLAEVAADPVGVNNALGRWTTGANLLDLCAAAVPCGQRHDGLPFGVTLLGPAFADGVVRTAAARLVSEPDPPPPPWSGWATVMVVGAHLSGQPLNGQLTQRGGRLLGPVSTASCYRLFALATDPPKPGMVRVAPGSADGISVPGELWALPVDRFGEFVLDVPAPLTIGSVELSDRSVHPSFLCETWALSDALDISHHGGWLAYRSTNG